MDRITLTGMRFEGRHGVSDEERSAPQLLEVDVEVEADLGAAGRSDDLGDTVDYGRIVAIARGRVEDVSYRLLEALAAAIAQEVLEVGPAVRATVVRVRKLAVPIDADLDHAQVEIRRERSAPAT